MLFTRKKRMFDNRIFKIENNLLISYTKQLKKTLKADFDALYKKERNV